MQPAAAEHRARDAHGCVKTAKETHNTEYIAGVNRGYSYLGNSDFTL